MGQMSVLMSLRKVCNHPDLFEERPIVSPFRMQGLHQHYPSLVQTASERLITNNSDYTNRTDPFLHASLLSHNLPNQCRHMDNGSSGVRLQQLLTPAAEVTANSAGLYAMQAMQAMQPHPPSSFCTTVRVFVCFFVFLFVLPYL